MYDLKNKGIMKVSILLILISLVYACHFPNIFDSNGGSSDTLLVVKITGGIAGVNGRVVIQQSGLAVSTDLFRHLDALLPFFSHYRNRA